MKAKLVLATTAILFLSMFAIAAYSVENSKAVGVWLFNEEEGDAVRDSSGNNHHGQIHAGVERISGTSGATLDFPGHGEASYVRIPYKANLDLAEHSITAWIKLIPQEVMPTENAWQLLIGKWQPQGVRNYSLMARRDTGIILTQFSSGGEKQYKNVIGKTKLTDEEWHHIASTYDGSILRLYVDGALEAEIESPEPDRGTRDITIGAASGGTYSTKGAIDDVGLFNTALEKSEIKEIMTDGLWNALGLEETTGMTLAIEEAVEAAVKNAVSTALDKKADSHSGIEFGGALESEFSHVNGNGDSGNDFVLSTVELAAEAQLGEHINGSMIFLYEQGENDDNIAVDEGLINLSLPVAPSTDLGLSLGLMCVPFGEFSSHFIADPYTCDIGETSQLALEFLHTQNGHGDENSIVSQLALGF